MIFEQLLNIEVKSFLRNEKWRRNILGRILAIIFILYVVFLFIIISIYLEDIFFKLSLDPIYFFGKSLIPYIIIDIFLRTLLQPFPTLESVALLKSRFKKSTVINYVLLRSYLNAFNFLPWLLIVPFGFKILFVQTGLSGMLFYFVCLTLVIAVNNYLCILIKFLSFKGASFILIQLILIALLFYLPEISIVSQTIGSQFIQGNVLVLIPLLITLFALIFILRNLMVEKLYLDQVSSYNGRINRVRELILDFSKFFKNDENRFYIVLEINLILRNKRIRQALSSAVVFTIYFIFIIYYMGLDGVIKIPIFAVVMASGAGFYGNLIFSWESSYFDGLMARKINFTAYILAKYYLMIAFTLFSFVIMMVFGLITQKINFLMIFSLFAFTLGPANILFLIFATFNTGRVNLSKSSLFNSEGFTTLSIVYPLFVFTLPLGIYTFFNSFINETVGYLTITFLGFSGFLFHKKLIDRIVVPMFLSRKYKNLEGYRKLSV